jgi:tetratricopeptide (TPR) repeat protein
MEENSKTLRKNVEELYKQSKFEEIIAQLTDEVLEREKDAELYAWRSIVNYKLEKNVFETMHFAKKAIAADPTYFMGYFAKACAWSDKRENDKAIADYTNAIKLNPDFVEAYYNRGIAWQTINENDKANADYNKAIAIYDKAIASNPENAELYLLKGNVWYNKKDHVKTTTYDKAIVAYEQAIKLNPNYELAFYNNGLAKVAKGDYKGAIKDFDKVIELKPYEDAYVSRGNIKRVFNEDYDGSIADYTSAINLNHNNQNAYYYMGIAYYNKALKEKEINIDHLIKKSKEDFEKYLKLTTDENDNGVKYAKQYVEDLKVVIENPNLWSIKQLVNNIKDKLWIRKEDCITHYTSLSVLKNLIFDDSKFRISEGNFLNDPSEGKEFFKFLKYKPDTFSKASPSSESVSPKPFIGSFVTKDKRNNLNLWRFYGKEKGEEAKGCAITLRTEEFIENIENSLSNEKNKEARLDKESDIKFYQVVYVKGNGAAKFYITNPNKRKELERLMKELKEKVKPYKKGSDRTFLEKDLNSIAFLFKNDAYKNEDEVRLVMNGIEFEKKYNMCVSSPRVYIELVSIKDIVSQIILGPKVDKGSEWMAAFHYRYEKSAPEIKFSHLPYK